MVELTQPLLSPPPPCPLPKICKKRVLIAAVFSIFFQFDDNWLILQGGDNKKQQKKKKTDNNIIEEEKRVLHKPKSLLCFSRSPSKTRQSSNAYKKNFQKRKTMSQHIIFFFCKSGPLVDSEMNYWLLPSKIFIKILSRGRTQGSRQHWKFQALISPLL